MPSVFKRGKTYYTKFRTPKRFSSVESRKQVVVSLRTNSRSIAVRLAPVIRAEHEIAWSRKAGEGQDAHNRRIVDLAEQLGFQYRTAAEIAAGATRDIIARLGALPLHAGPTSEVAKALLGGVPRERLRVSGLVEAYSEVIGIERSPRTGEQLRVWRSARSRAARNFIEAVGDLPIEEISRDHARRWMATLRQAVREGRPGGAGPIKAQSANKEISYMAAMVTRTLDDRGLPNDFPFSGMRILDPNAKSATRLPIPEDLIRSIILDPDKTAGLDPEALDALLAMVDTGARPSEVIGLMPWHIHLDHPVPHISLCEEMRKLKTTSSERVIPLVGVSLEAMRRRPRGFPRYRGRVTAWGGLVNSHLRKAGLPEPLTAYGLRHAFADRLIDAEFSERIIADAMGHRVARERYGKGLSLERRREVLERIAVRC